MIGQRSKPKFKPDNTSRLAVIRLDESTIKQLLAAKIDQAAISEGEKKTLKKHLATLSGKDHEALTADLVEKAVDLFPDAIGLLKTAFGL